MMENAKVTNESKRVMRELFTALQSKYSLEHYLRITYDMVQMPLTLCDTSFCVLAAAPSLAAMDPNDFDVMNGKQYLKLDVTEEMDKKNHTARIMESYRPYVVRDARFPNEILFQPVRINRAVVAYVFCQGRPEGFRQVDLEVIEFLAQILAIEMQKNDTFAVESGLKYEYFLQELLEGHFSSDEFAERRLRQLNRMPQPYYFMLAFAFDDPESVHAAGKYYYDQLLNIFPEGMVGVVDGRLCLLLPCGEPKAFREREQQALEKFLEFNCMSCGVSYYCTSLLLAKYAMEQAVACLERGHEEARILCYEQEYLNHVFSRHDRARMRSKIHPDIRLIAAYDKQYRTELLHTLRTYIFCGRSASAASEELHIHKSTFFYRMNKIQEILGVNIYDGHRLFSYEFSFHLIDYLKGRDSGDNTDLLGD